MTTLIERRRARHFKAKAEAAQQEETCELCPNKLGEQSVSASDGTNEPVRICLECSGFAAQPGLSAGSIALPLKEFQ